MGRVAASQAPGTVEPMTFPPRAGRETARISTMKDRVETWVLAHRWTYVAAWAAATAAIGLGLMLVLNVEPAAKELTFFVFGPVAMAAFQIHLYVRALSARRSPAA